MNSLAQQLLSEEHPSLLAEAIVHKPEDLPSVGDVVSVVEMSDDHEIATLYFEGGRTVCVHLITPNADLTISLDALEPAVGTD